MKVIFLDIDGVLITRETCRKGFGIVDPNCVALLNKLTDETGAVFVLSSCWRIGQEVIELREQLIKWGVTGKLIGRTGETDDIRGKEIARWILDCPREIDNFVILDDDKDMGTFMDRLVQTTFEHGLQQEHVDKIKSMLEGTLMQQLR